MVPEGLSVTHEDGIIEAVISRGDDRNLLTVDICEHLGALLETPPDGAHVLRLRSVGPAFCLGRERAADDPVSLRLEAEALTGLNAALRLSRLVTVAEVHGDAAGFGVGLVANVDVAIAAASARFWFPEVRIDLAPAVVLSWLPRIVGRKQAFWLTASGEPIDARRAFELGLVTQVALGTDLRGASDHVVSTLRGFAPRVHAGIKGYLQATEELPFAAAANLATERLILGSLSRRHDGEH